MKPVLAIALCLLCSCSAEKRLLRLLERNPQLRDTVVVEAIVEHVKTDTVFVPTEADTVTIVNDRLTMRFVDVPGPTVWLEGECRSDTVRVDVPVIQPVVTKEIVPWWAYALIGLALILSILAVLRR